MSHVDIFEQVRVRFFWRRIVSLPDGRQVTVALLLREEDWRPLDAPWWREKQASIIGADIDGNFFLNHCDGSVRYWDHKTQANIVVARSVREFARLIKEGNENAA
ncbi:MAG: hypothetical protein V4805_06425 [Pseudomonadota bacterium]